MPTSTVEDYLKAIWLTASAGEEAASPGLVGMGQIAAALDVAPGTVTSMVKTLAASGLVAYEPYSGVRLTDAGRRLALHVLRRHRLIELFLVQVVGLDWSEVHAEAERLEHVVSDRLVERLDELLGHPEVDPHGDPIPTPSGEVERQEDMSSLMEWPTGESGQVVRVLDQSEEFLHVAERLGLMPGARLTILRRDEVAGTLELEVDGAVDGAAGGSLGTRAAARILVRGG